MESKVIYPIMGDNSLFFDDDGKVYMNSGGGGKLRLVELKDDLSGIKPGGTDETVIENASLPSGGTGLPA